MRVRRTIRGWSVLGAAAIWAAGAGLGCAADDDATETNTSRADTGGSVGSTSSTTMVTTTTTTIESGFTSPEKVAADRYGESYLGDCEGVQIDGDRSPDAVCSLAVTLDTSEVVLLVGPPYSEVSEFLLVRLGDGRWTLADSYVPGELGVPDPDEPKWVRTAIEIKDGLRESG